MDVSAVFLEVTNSGPISKQVYPMPSSSHKEDLIDAIARSRNNIKPH